MTIDEFTSTVYDLISHISVLPLEDKVRALNEVRSALHTVSPFSREPVDNVQWVPVDSVQANDYNPNTVAPAEMELLCHSIRADGYTQPIVTYQEENNPHYEVVDGFHRKRVGSEQEDIKARCHNYIPIVQVDKDRGQRRDRIAATVRHNRARGRHGITAMSDIVVELVRLGWTNEEIGTELGMELDEVLRLKQVTGLAILFADREFSEAWGVFRRSDMEV